MQSLTFLHSGSRRALASGLAAAMLILSFVAFPSVRAAADGFLQTFRAQSVIFLPVDMARLQQIQNAGGSLETMFITKPQIVGNPTTTQVNSADKAAKAVGFAPQLPSTLPGKTNSTVMNVHGSTTVSAQVNVDNIRQAILAMGINDVNLPQALGSAPITAQVPPFLETQYIATNYEMTLVQGRSPSVSLPAGVDLAELGKAGLRVLGMPADQADQMSNQIDWSSTLVIPFPTDLNNISQVQVGDAQGMLVDTGNSSILYWQHGDHFYVLEGKGLNFTDADLLAAARSMK